MKVVFLEEWRGSKVGDVLELADDFCTLDLIPRKIVKPVKTTEQVKIKEQADEIAELKKQLKAKQIDAPPADKQFKKGGAKTK